MKILFLIGTPAIDAVSTWDEIKIYKDKGYLAPSKDYYSIFKAMEQNTELEQEILSARHNAGIPDTGITWDDYYKNYYLKSLTVYDEKESKKYQDFFSKVRNEARRIIKEKKPNAYIVSQLENLIIGSFVLPQDIPIAYGALLKASMTDLTHPLKKRLLSWMQG